MSTDYGNHFALAVPPSSGTGYQWHYPLAGYLDHLQFSRTNGAGSHVDVLLHIRVAGGVWLVFHDPELVASLSSTLNWPTSPAAHSLFIRTRGGWVEAARFAGDDQVHLWDFSPADWIYFNGFRWINGWHAVRDISTETDVFMLRYPGPYSGGRSLWVAATWDQRVMAATHEQGSTNTTTDDTQYTNRADVFVLDIAGIRAYMPPYARTVTMTWSFTGYSDAIDSMFRFSQVLPTGGATTVPLAGTYTAAFDGVYNSPGLLNSSPTWAVRYTVPQRSLTFADWSTLVTSYNPLVLDGSVIYLPLPDVVAAQDPGHIVQPDLASLTQTFTYDEWMALDSLVYRLDVVPGTDGSGAIGGNVFGDYTGWFVAPNTYAAVTARLEGVSFTV